MFKMVAKCIFFFFFRSVSRSFGVETATCVKWLQNVSSSSFSSLFFRSVSRSFGVEAATCVNTCKMYLLFFFRSVSRSFGVETATCFKWLQNVSSFFSGAFPVLLVWKQQHVSNGCKMEIFVFRSVSRFLDVETATCLKWLQNVSSSSFSGAFPVLLVWKQQHVSNGCKMYLLCLFPERFSVFWCGNSNMCQMVANVSPSVSGALSVPLVWKQQHVSNGCKMYLLFFSGAFPVLLVWKQQHVSNGCKMEIFFPGALPVILVWKQHVSNGCKMEIFVFQSVSRDFDVETATRLKWLQNVSSSSFSGAFPVLLVWKQQHVSNGCKMYLLLLLFLLFFSGAFPVLLVWKQQHVSNSCKMYLLFFPERFPFFWCGNSNMFQMVAKCIFFFLRSVSRSFGVETATCFKWLQNGDLCFPERFPVFGCGNSNMFKMVAKCIFFFFFRSVSRSFGVETATCVKWLQNVSSLSFSGAFPGLLVWKQQHVSNGCKCISFCFRSAFRSFGVEAATCVKWLQNVSSFFPERFPIF